MVAGSSSTATHCKTKPSLLLAMVLVFLTHIRLPVVLKLASSFEMSLL